ncbi:hypothetical protein NLI96_g11833 [Meripilus lineatus]|uniref:Cupin type-1 domain-containing protein n=1 Tax=Meripilus lineatus TaxID=2056292 RepID=A0AAD5YCZ3_9APHY|nr:hypothetical protein NLI96_g11833 [Physisporinus lineatus]
MHTLSFSLVAIALSGCALAQSDNASKVAALKLAATEVEKIQILSEDSDFVFDFSTATPVKGADGDIVTANVANFPVLTGEITPHSSYSSPSNSGPCGMNTPHTHPRATELLYVVNGTIQAGMIQENGARFVYNEVNAGQATIFPKGAIHYQQNMGCDPIVFVAALNNEDPGVQSTAQRCEKSFQIAQFGSLLRFVSPDFGLPPAFVAASLGDLGVVEVAGLEAKIPDNIAFGTDECLQRCGIQRPTQPTNQRQPRVSANALPSGFSGPPPPPPASTSSKQVPTPLASNHARRSVSESTNESEVNTSKRVPSRWERFQVPETLVISSGYNVNNALVGLIGLMAFGYVGIALFFIRRHSGKSVQVSGVQVENGDEKLFVHASERYTDRHPV